MFLTPHYLPHPSITLFLIYSTGLLFFLVTTVPLLPSPSITLKLLYQTPPLFSSLLITTPGFNLAVTSIVLVLLLRIWFYIHPPLITIIVLIISVLKLTSFWYVLNKVWPHHPPQDNLLLANSINTIHPPTLYLAGALLLCCTYLVVRLADTPTVEELYFLYRQVAALLSNRTIFIILPTLALLLGCFWANQVGTWGGWWVWDPSEVLILLLVAVVTLYYHIVASTPHFIRGLSWLTAFTASLLLYQFYCFQFLESTLHSFFSAVSTSNNLLQLILIGTMLWYLAKQIFSITYTKGQAFTQFQNSLKLPYSYTYLLLFLPILLLPIFGVTVVYLLVQIATLTSLLYTFAVVSHRNISNNYHKLSLFVLLWLSLGLFRLDFLSLNVILVFSKNLSVSFITTFSDQLTSLLALTSYSLFAHNNLYLTQFSFLYATSAVLSLTTTSPITSIYYLWEGFVCMLSFLIIFVFRCSSKIILIGWSLQQ